MASESEVTSGKRIFPPLYVQTGDISKDRLAFIHILERLKVKANLFYLFTIFTRWLIIKNFIDSEKNGMG